MFEKKLLDKRMVLNFLEKLAEIDKVRLSKEDNASLVNHIKKTIKQGAFDIKTTT